MNEGTSDQDEARRALARMGLLGEAGSWLATTLDLGRTMERVAALAVPVLADGCTVQLVGRPGPAPELEQPPLESVALVHVDKDVESRARGLVGSRPHALQRSFGVLEVLRTGLPQAVDDLAREPDQPEPSLLRELSAQSYLALPLSARGQLLGVLTLVRCEPVHPEREALLANDLALVNELARRAGAAIDNALLYRDAQQAIAVRDDLLQLVSHDLQSPLNAIALTVKRLSAEPELLAIPGTRRALALIERTTRHIGQLTTELLQVGSIQSGQLALEPRPTPLPPVIGEALSMLEPLLLEKHLRVSARLEPRLPSAACDRNRILRVLMNLLGNAIKFNTEGGELVIAARTVGEQVEVSIRDTGAGIASEDLPKLFDPYWRSRQAGRHGLGLGLYIARGIVEAHGGQIWAESELGTGSTFVFRLAIAAAEGTSPG
jgi:signal transduction histidine kinase